MLAHIAHYSESSSTEASLSSVHTKINVINLALKL